ncbi:MAG: DUF6362 family protein [Acetobacteraceae bacterium]
MSQFHTEATTAEAHIDAALVTRRLEEAGAALLALPNTGWTTRLRTSNLDIVRIAMDSYAPADKRIRPPVPSAAEISRMDEAMGWILLIPVDRYVLRRIVGARSLVNPITERHLFPWRRLAAAMGADHKAIQRWHAEGISRIVAALNGVEAGGRASAQRSATTGGRADNAAAGAPEKRERPRFRQAQPA